MQRRTLLTLTPAALLAACGFRLRGVPQFAFRSLYIAAPADSLLALELRRTLEAVGGALQVLADPASLPQAEAVFELLSEKQERSVVGFNASGQARELELRLRIRRPTWCSNCCAGWLQSNPESARFQRAGRSRISVLLPNSDSTRSTASRAVLLRTSSAGFSSTMSSEARRPLSAIISMHSCASR